MRNESNLLGGTSLILEHPADLDALPPPLVTRISPAARQLFAGFPASVEQLASTAPRASLGRALARLAAESACELEIHQAGYPIPNGDAVYVRLGTPPVLVSGALDGVPDHCPVPLADVLLHTGVVALQYGYALGLLPPVRQVALVALMAEFDALYPGEIGRIALPAVPEAFHAVYEDSGVYLCADPTGATWYFSSTGGTFGSGPPIGDWLDSFFDAGPFGPGWPIGN
jgi:hypothetical protein